MTIATDPLLQHQPLSVEEFFARYGSDNRYELIDGEVFDLEPTGPNVREASPKELEVAAFITTKVCVQIDTVDLP